ncbi:MAG: hydrogenase maturation protease [Candidatus Methanoplasma sp.]|jgi:hydrogenase maturation protease|nr:hydrogenase maturation protease [Candidatus Methanoplasma sp.]
MAGLNGRTIVIGLGSPIMSDDAIGLRVSEAVGRLGMPGVDAIQEAAGGLEVIPMVRGYSFAVIVDAIQTGAHPPGTVMIFDLEDFAGTVADVPAHDVNLATALEVGRRLEPGSMPEAVKLVAVEAADLQTVSEEMTPAVAAAEGAALDAALHVIAGFTGLSPTRRAS